MRAVKANRGTPLGEWGISERNRRDVVGAVFLLAARTPGINLYVKLVAVLGQYAR
ncbi:MAG: hypothetical protein AAB072_02220 [Nitrospirota bacterium]